MLQDISDIILVYGKICRILLTHMNVCQYCKHCFVKISKDDGIKFCCDAFPDGIPNSVFSSGYDHREPFPNDNGIRFEIRENLSEGEQMHLKFAQMSVFSRGNNERILKMIEASDDTPDCAVYEYCGSYDDDDKDFETGKKFIEDYDRVVPVLLRDGDSDPVMPRSLEELLKDFKKEMGLSDDRG